MFFDPITGPILGSNMHSTTSAALQRKAFASFSNPERSQLSGEPSVLRTAADALSTSGLTVEGYSGIRSVQPSPARCGIPLAPPSQSILKESSWPRETTTTYTSDTSGGVSHIQTTEIDGESRMSCVVDSLVHVGLEDLAGLSYAHVRAMQDYFLPANDPYYAHEEEDMDAAGQYEWGATTTTTTTTLSPDLYKPFVSPLEEEKALGLSPILSPITTPIQPYLARPTVATPSVGPTVLRQGPSGHHEVSLCAPSEARTIGSPSPIMPRISAARSFSPAASTTATPFSATPPRPRVVQFKSPSKEDEKKRERPSSLQPPPPPPQRIEDVHATESPAYKLHGAHVDIMVSPQNMYHAEHEEGQGRNWTLADFEVGPKLGEGRFGKIYLARERRTKVGVVLKCISKEMLLYNDLLTQMHREIELQSYVGRHHRHVLKMHGYFWDSERIFLLLEYADGGSLSAFAAQQPNSRLSEAQVQTVARQLTSALCLMHRFHILHRDIKPENVLLQKGKCKLADFSWAVRSSGLRARRFTVCGTLDYLSPEQVLQRGATAASDMWSLGVMCYELLTGTVPFGDGLSPTETCACIAKGEVLAWPTTGVTEKAKSFLRALLQVDEKRRLTAPQALQHPFLSGEDVLLVQKEMKQEKPTHVGVVVHENSEQERVPRRQPSDENASVNLSEMMLPHPQFASFTITADTTNVLSTSTNNANIGSLTTGAPLRLRTNSSGSFLTSDVSLSVNSCTCGPSTTTGAALLAGSGVSGVYSEERSTASTTLIVSSLTATSFDEHNQRASQNGSTTFSGVSALSSPEPPTPMQFHLDNRRAVQPLAKEGTTTTRTTRTTVTAAEAVTLVALKEHTLGEAGEEEHDAEHHGTVPTFVIGRDQLVEPKRSVSLSETRQGISHSLARSSLQRDAEETDIGRLPHRSGESCIQRLDFDCYSSTNSSSNESNNSNNNISVEMKLKKQTTATFNEYGKESYHDFCCTPPQAVGSAASSPALSPVPFHQD